MAYIYLDKSTYEVKAFSSIKALHLDTKINLDTLYYHFTRLKKDVYERDNYKIAKVDIISSKRK